MQYKIDFDSWRVEFEEAGVAEAFDECRSRLASICVRRVWLFRRSYNWCTLKQVATQTAPQIAEMVTCVSSILAEVSYSMTEKRIWRCCTFFFSARVLNAGKYS